MPDAAAQQIYRSVGPDGRITFSDRAPPDGSGTAKAAPVVTMPRDATDVAVLPFELRQAATRYPVTLYAGPSCDPCAAARSLLARRGIPYAEKTVSSNEDIEALRRLAGVATLPVLAIGGERVKGYSDVEWNQLLDAAGYPRTSQLPAGYQQSPAQPLVAIQDVPPVRPASPPAAPPAPAAPPSAPPPSRSGIQF
ncbi:glutaredoxin family protein [Ramlibacter sp.]|uniref:glutaredoxin family protein n=1 Tax=Ramlibacter sp. TaxID=1917967 RepID=UPI002CFC5C48|nr:glutaredoxin family protein [Ramlibacter sp.]HWI81640.1 glutaredoxin family protein [Ramlibacter sp.]